MSAYIYMFDSRTNQNNIRLPLFSVLSSTCGLLFQWLFKRTTNVKSTQQTQLSLSKSPRLTCTTGKWYALLNLSLNVADEICPWNTTSVFWLQEEDRRVEKQKEFSARRCCSLVVCNYKSWTCKIHCKIYWVKVSRNFSGKYFPLTFVIHKYPVCYNQESFVMDLYQSAIEG